MPEKTIKMHQPDIGDLEKQYLTETLSSGLLAGNQKTTKDCEQLINDITGSKASFLTTSCTHSLEIAALSLDFKEGDEVIVPSYSFVSTALAFFMHGAVPRFCDVKREDLNIDENKLDNLINEKTKAICVLHYGGKACNIEQVLQIASKYNLKVIEDNAHGLGGKLNQKVLGSFGSISCLSFHETKNLTCGEGGAVCINDEELIEKIKFIREKGTNRAAFFEGKIDRYNWIEKGSNYLPSELQASVLKAQLERFDEIQLKRETIWNTYQENLSDLCKKYEIVLPSVNSNVVRTHHIFHLLFKEDLLAKNLIHHLNRKKIQATSHYRPLNKAPFILNQLSIKDIDPCPVAEQAADCMVRLPLSSRMTSSDAERVINEVKNFIVKN